MPTPNRTIGVLGKVKRPGDALTRNRAVWLGFTTHSTIFTTPNPTAAALNTQGDRLATAITTAVHGTRADRVTRETERKATVAQLRIALAYAQGLADASPDQAEFILRSAGFEIKTVTPRQKRTHGAKAGRVSGTAVLTAPSIGSAHDWQMSSNGGTTWVDLPSTQKSITTVTGLTLGASYLFRHRALTKLGEGDWSAPFPFIAH